jgi:hypothetical protein
MLNVIAPFGLSDFLHSLAQAAGAWRESAYMAIVGCYWFLFAKATAAVLSRVDFAIATNLRRMRLSPPAIQFWLGDFFERLPGRIAKLAVCGLLLTLLWSSVRHSPLDPSSAMVKFRDFWSLVIDWFWHS